MLIGLSSSQQEQQQQRRQRPPTAPKINNIKAHIYLTEEGRDRLLTNIKLFDISTVRHHNFSVSRDPRGTRRVYIIFEKEGFVNITGIREISSLKDVIPQLCLHFSLLQTDVASPQPLIDNISASGSFNCRIDLNRLRKILNAKGKNDGYFTVILNRNKFPGASCRAKGYGTITVFTTGKYVIVGSKSVEVMEQVFLKMSDVINSLGGNVV